MCPLRVGEEHPLFSLYRALWRPTAPASWKNAVGRQRNLGLQSNLSIRSPVLTSHLQLNIAFSCLVMEKFISIELILRGSFSYKALFSLSKRWPLNTGLTVLIQNMSNIINSVSYLDMKYTILLTLLIQVSR